MFNLRDIRADRFQVFFGCLHRWTSSQDMEEKLARLILLGGRSPRQNLARVIETLAESIIESNNAFIDTKILIKLSITNVFYDTEDPSQQASRVLNKSLSIPPKTGWGEQQANSR